MEPAGPEQPELQTLRELESQPDVCSHVVDVRNQSRYLD